MQDDTFQLSRKEELGITAGLILAAIAVFIWVLIEIANKPVNDTAGNLAIPQQSSSRMATISKSFAE